MVKFSRIKPNYIKFTKILHKADFFENITTKKEKQDKISCIPNRLCVFQFSFYFSFCTVAAIPLNTSSASTAGFSISIAF
jgi:hypothetical protein